MKRSITKASESPGIDLITMADSSIHTDRYYSF